MKLQNCRNDAAPEEITNDESATEETKGYLIFSLCIIIVSEKPQYMLYATIF
jgi:hypothetical protein